MKQQARTRVYGIVAAFERLPLHGSYLLDLCLEPTLKLVVTLLEDPSRVATGRSCRRWDLQLNRVASVQLTLSNEGRPMQLQNHSAEINADKSRASLVTRSSRPASRAHGPFTRFTLKFEGATVQVTALDFTLSVVDEIPVKRATPQ
jgi:hypothetical protein